MKKLELFQAIKLGSSVDRKMSGNKTSSSNDNGNKIKNDDNAHLLDTSHMSQYSHNFDVIQPFLKKYSLALSTTILATGAFALSLASSLSCAFLQVPADAYDDITQTDHYLDYNRSREKDEVLTLGLFCEEDLKFTIDPTSKEHFLRKLSKSFLIMALILGAVNMCVTWSIATFLSSSSRTWNGITVLSIGTLILQLPAFAIFESPPCDSYKCVLATGGFALICSAFMNFVLVVVTYFLDVPEWKEEWELWRLVKSNQDKGLERGDIDLEIGIGVSASDVENGTFIRGVYEGKNDSMNNNIIAKFEEKEISKKVEKIDAWGDLHNELESATSDNSSANKEQLCNKLPTRRMKNKNLVISIPNILTTKEEKYIIMDEHEASPETPFRHGSFAETPVSPMTADGLDGDSAVRQHCSPIMACTGSRYVPSADVSEGVCDGIFEDGAELDAFLAVGGAGDFKANHASTAVIVSPEKSDLEALSMTSLDKMKEISLKEESRRKPSTSFNKDRSSGEIHGKELHASEKYECENAENVGNAEIASSEDLICNNVERLNDDAVFSPPPIIVREFNSAVISPIGDESEGNQMKPSPTKLTEKISRCAVASPENDPDVEYYPSESSMSEISLPTGSEQNSATDTDDDNAHAALALSVASDDSNDSSDSSDMNAIIAGVQARNRRTSGKITPMNKRRRRRRKSKRRCSSDISSGNSYSSCGSLLDEIIPEEADADLSNEKSPQKVYTGPTIPPKHIPPTITTDFTKASTKTQNAATRIRVHFSDDDQSGYESGYLSRASNGGHVSSVSSRSSRSSFISPKASRYCQLLDHGEVLSFAGYVSVSSQGSSNKFSSEESMSLRAARARRSRILSNKKIHILPNEMPPHRVSRLQDGFEFQFQQTEDERISFVNSGFVSSDDEGVGNLSVRSNVSWQARKYRMNRLRMQRCQSMKTVEGKHHNNVRVSDDNIACDSDEGSI
mmetsp:Transcript_532/g.1080  ORF Transcript_532/g.1080 Transcript_532/m.1080 type:complete len:966 (-) Transcript_532:102-2999(-)